MTVPPKKTDASFASPDFVTRLAQKFRPDLTKFSGDGRMARVTNVVGVLFTLPFAIAGLIWLGIIADWTLISLNLPFVLLTIALIAALNQLTFYFVTDLGEREGGSYGNVNGNLESVVRWSAIFLWGPTVLWLVLLADILVNFLFWRGARDENKLDRTWNLLRIFSFNTASLTFLPLVSLTAYRALDGTFPISGLSFANFLAGASAVAIQFFLENLLLWVGYLGYSLWAIRERLTYPALLSIFRLYALGLVIPAAANLLSAPLAGIYVESDPWLYVFFNLTFLAMSWLANRMSLSIEQSRNQTAQIEKLEALGRAILNAPPDNSTLPDLLIEHAASMFTYARLLIWLSPDQILLKLPKAWDAQEMAKIQSWLAKHPQPFACQTDEPLPWHAESLHQPPHCPTLLAPILDVESKQLLGGIYLELALLGQPLSRKVLNLHLPTLQSLAAQIASALYRTVVHERSLAHQKTQTELEFARRIQTGFLPASLPAIDGWQIAASLDPAREMSGDFYDLIPLPSGKLGILIADVADKGIGPALFMALSRTLIRTFAAQFESQPAKVMQSVNERIFQDTGENLFVTAFYGVLDPNTGFLAYVNAGHNPPLLVRAANLQTPEYLSRTGAALGAMEDLTWDAKSVVIDPGDALILYTDGVTEAQNAANDLFGSERLWETIHNRAASNADEIHTSVLKAIRAFTGNAPQSDDITLITIKRLP